MKLLFATTNSGKLRELRQLVGDTFEIVTPNDLHLNLEVEEDADTYADNARKKAKAFCQASGLPSLADDSGLSVEALQGRPGVHSARYAENDPQRIARLLQELQGQPSRKAAFHTVLCVAFPESDEVWFSHGVCEGHILYQPTGTGGFGYDPIFFVEEVNKPMAELTLEEKAVISHRGKAFRALVKRLQTLTAR